MQLFAITTRGLEELSEAEFRSIPGYSHDRTSYRRITGAFRGNLNHLGRVKTVDDMFLFLEEWTGVLHTREMLQQFQTLSAALPLSSALDIIRNLRSVSSPATFSISVSFVGRRNYSSDEVKEACALGICRATGWTYSGDDRLSAVNIRIFIEHDFAVIGMRIFSRPAHERSYKQQQVPGSLKPPVAAAMLQMIETTADDQVLDPCCGAGTILIEAQALGANVFGGDISPEAVAAARQNSGESIAFSVWDATSLPLADHSVSVVASNLPWDRQISIDQVPEDFYTSACREIERVCDEQARAVLLTTLPHLVRLPSFTPVSRTEISLFGQRPTILAFQRK